MIVILRIQWRPYLLAYVAVVLSAGGCKGARSSAEPTEPAFAFADLFGDHAISVMEFEFSEAAVAALKRRGKQWVPATLRFRGALYRDVAVRIKGNRSRMAFDKKPALKLRFDKWNREARFLGHRKLTLNNMHDDRTMVREMLGYAVYRAAGVPAPRTGYANVKVNGEHYGLYLVLESYDEQFFAANYQDALGPLYEGEYGCDIYTDDVDGFDHEHGIDVSRSAFRALAARVAADGIRVLGADGPFDTGKVIAYLATSAFIGDFDGYRNSHNYKLFYDRAAKRWSFLPWGIDRVFRTRLGIYESNGLMARLCFSDRDCRVRYLGELQRVANIFDAMAIPGRLATLDGLIGPSVAADKRRPYDDAKMAEKRATLNKFIAERSAEIRKATACLRDGVEVDADGDGFGCMDCNDDDPQVHPGREEVCDGKDNNCSRQIDDAPACACQRKVIDGVAFRLCDVHLSWTEAEAFCRAKGYQLARMDNRDHAKALFAATQEVYEDYWWIGLSDRGEEDDWQWSDGTPVGFTYWADDQPDNDPCNEDCAAIDDDKAGGWIDSHCEGRWPFVCRE